jgi:hypothetical protein
VQRVLHPEGEELADECRCLQLWASMLKRMTVSERATVQDRQHGFNLQVEAIAQRDADSRRALADTKQEEDLAVRARQVNLWEREVEKLEGLLQE